MWQEVESLLPQVSDLRRLLFAVASLPKDTPKYMDIIMKFVFGYNNQDKAEKIRILIENLEFLDNKAFSHEKELLLEIQSLHIIHDKPLGVILVSNKTICKLCGGKLLVRSDRPSFISVYSDEMGTVPGTHFRKYCQNTRKKCPFVQYYGYHKLGESTDAIYDEDWEELLYFISSSMTAFTSSFLHNFDGEILIGQITYKQKSDIYNYQHKYEQIQKKTSTCGIARTESDSEQEDGHQR